MKKKVKKTCMHKQPVDKHWPNLLNAGMAVTATATQEEIYIAFTKNCFIGVSRLTEAGSLHQ